MFLFVDNYHMQLEIIQAKDADKAGDKTADFLKELFLIDFKGMFQFSQNTLKNIN